MVRRSFRKIEVKSLIYMAFCGIGVLGFLLIAIIPNQLAINDIQREIKEVETRITKQDILYPFYLQILKQVRHLDERSRNLPFPKEKALARHELGQVHRDFSRAAAEAGMEIELSPDLGSITGDSQTMTVDGSFRGPFFSLRELLVELGKIPYLKQVDTMEIRALPDSVNCKIKFRLAIERA